MKTRQIAHNDYPAARYRCSAQRALLYRRYTGVLSAAHTQMISRNHTVADDGTDNDDVDEHASKINRGMRADFFKEFNICTRPRNASDF